MELGLKLFKYWRMTRVRICCDMTDDSIRDP